MKKKQLRPANNGAWPARPVADNFQNSLRGAAGDEGARISAMIGGLFNDIDFNRAYADVKLPDELPTEFLCIAPEETEMVLEYFQSFDARNEKAAYTHISLCDSCSEAVAVSYKLLEAAEGQKGWLHGGSRGGGLERTAESGESAEVASQFAGSGADRRGI
jgi:hypothetical protein